MASSLPTISVVSSFFQYILVCSGATPLFCGLLALGDFAIAARQQPQRELYRQLPHSALGTLLYSSLTIGSNVSNDAVYLAVFSHAARLACILLLNLEFAIRFSLEPLRRSSQCDSSAGHDGKGTTLRQQLLAQTAHDTLACSSYVCAAVSAIIVADGLGGGTWTLAAVPVGCGYRFDPSHMVTLLGNCEWRGWYSLAVPIVALLLLLASSFFLWLHSVRLRAGVLRPWARLHDAAEVVMNGHGGAGNASTTVKQVSSSSEATDTLADMLWHRIVVGRGHSTRGGRSPRVPDPWDVLPLVRPPIWTALTRASKKASGALGHGDFSLEASLDDPAEVAAMRRQMKRLWTLVHLGFGQAGERIISRSVGADGAVRDLASIRGAKVDAIFGFCDIKSFTDITECLQEHVLSFVCDVANIVHHETVNAGGAPNKNIGDAFLLVWKLPRKPITANKYSKRRASLAAGRARAGGQRVGAALATLGAIPSQDNHNSSSSSRGPVSRGVLGGDGSRSRGSLSRFMHAIKGSFGSHAVLPVGSLDSRAQDGGGGEHRLTAESSQRAMVRGSSFEWLTGAVSGRWSSGGTTPMAPARSQAVGRSTGGQTSGHEAMDGDHEGTLSGSISPSSQRGGLLSKLSWVRRVPSASASVAPDPRGPWRADGMPRTDSALAIIDGDAAGQTIPDSRGPWRTDSMGAIVGSQVTDGTAVTASTSEATAGAKAGQQSSSFLGRPRSFTGAVSSPTSPVVDNNKAPFVQTRITPVHRMSFARDGRASLAGLSRLVEESEDFDGKSTMTNAANGALISARGRQASLGHQSTPGGRNNSNHTDESSRHGSKQLYGGDDFSNTNENGGGSQVYGSTEYGPRSGSLARTTSRGTAGNNNWVEGPGLVPDRDGFGTLGMATGLSSPSDGPLQRGGSFVGGYLGAMDTPGGSSATPVASATLSTRKSSVAGYLGVVQRSTPSSSSFNSFKQVHASVSASMLSAEPSQQSAEGEAGGKPRDATVGPGSLVQTTGDADGPPAPGQLAALTVYAKAEPRVGHARSSSFKSSNLTPTQQVVQTMLQAASSAGFPSDADVTPGAITAGQAGGSAGLTGGSAGQGGSFTTAHMPGLPDHGTAKGHIPVGYRQWRGVTVLADNALAAFVNVIIKMHAANEPGGVLDKYRQMPAIRNSRLWSDSFASDGFRIKSGFGLHIGWAVEGAIGSSIKVDASYLSPAVNVTARLESATRFYGVDLLLSKDFASCLSAEAINLLRRVDRVKLKGVADPMDLYTFDWHAPAALEFLTASAKANGTYQEPAANGCSGSPRLGHGKGRTGLELPSGVERVSTSSDSARSVDIQGRMSRLGVESRAHHDGHIAVHVLPDGSAVAGATGAIPTQDGRTESEVGALPSARGQATIPLTGGVRYIPLPTQQDGLLRNGSLRSGSTTPVGGSIAQPSPAATTTGGAGGRHPQHAGTGTCKDDCTCSGPDCPSSSAHDGQGPFNLLQTAVRAASITGRNIYRRVSAAFTSSPRGSDPCLPATTSGSDAPAAMQHMAFMQRGVSGEPDADATGRRRSARSGSGRGGSASIPSAATAGSVSTGSAQASSAEAGSAAGSSIRPVSVHASDGQPQDVLVHGAMLHGAMPRSPSGGPGTGPVKDEACLAHEGQMADLAALQPESEFSQEFIDYAELTLENYLGDYDSGIPANWALARHYALKALELRPTDGPLMTLVQMMEETAEIAMETAKADVDVLDTVHEGQGHGVGGATGQEDKGTGAGQPAINTTAEGASSPKAATGRRRRSYTRRSDGSRRDGAGTGRSGSHRGSHRGTRSAGRTGSTGSYSSYARSYTSSSSSSSSSPSTRRGRSSTHRAGAARPGGQRASEPSGGRSMSADTRQGPGTRDGSTYSERDDRSNSTRSFAVSRRSSVDLPNGGAGRGGVGAPTARLYAMAPPAGAATGAATGAAAGPSASATTSAAAGPARTGSFIGRNSLTSACSGGPGLGPDGLMRRLSAKASGQGGSGIFDRRQGSGMYERRGSGGSHLSGRRDTQRTSVSGPGRRGTGYSGTGSGRLDLGTLDAPSWWRGYRVLDVK